MSDRSALRVPLTFAICMIGFAFSGCDAGSSSAPQPRNAGVSVSPASTDVIRRGVTIPFWKRTFESNGSTYTASIVGTDPALGSATTVVPNEIIPVDLTFSNDASTDGGPAAAIVAASPIYVKTKFKYEKTQFGDAVIRDEFASIITEQPYDVLLAPPTIEPPITIAVPATEGYATLHNGNVEGFVDVAFFMQNAEWNTIVQLGLPPTALALFVTTRTQLIEPDGRCCYFGFHKSFVVKTPTGKMTYTTAWASALPGEVTMVSHEVNEWLNDPFDDNIVPAWVNPRTMSCDSDKLEVGDPLVNVSFHQNGYQLQDVAFYSWFSRDNPSIGLNGLYDFLGRLTAPATVCTK